MTNVVQLEEFLGLRRDPAVRPYAGVLAECRRLVAERLGRALSAAMEDLDADLQARRLAAEATPEKDLLVETQFQLRNLGLSVNRRFLEVYEREFQIRITPEPTLMSIYGSESRGILELSLADDDQIADELLVQQHTKQLDKACETELKELRVRVAHMLGESALADRRDPIGPGAISSALKEIVWQLDSPREAKMLLLDLFHHALLDPLPDLYREINALLVAHKVLPRIRHAVRHDRPRAAARLGAPPGEKPLDEATTAGIIERLFHGGARLRGQPEDTPGQRSAGERHADAVALLTRLQRGETRVALGQESFELSIDRCATDNVVYGLIEAGIGRHLGPVDAIVIDVVAALFDYIFQDPHVPSPVKGLIGRLQLPVLKLALLDHGFFANRAHPARRLVNTLAKSAAAWNGGVSLDSPLYRCAEPLVARIQDTFDQDTEVFATALADLEAFLAEQERQGGAEAARLDGKLGARERLELARMVADNATSAYLDNTAMPETVRRFIAETWHQVLTNAALGNTRDGTDWQAAIATLDNLAWSALPSRSTEDRQRLVKLLPALLEGLRSGLDKVGVQEHRQNAFFAELMALHAAAFKTSMTAGPAEPPPSEKLTPPPVEPAALTAHELDLLARGSLVSTKDDHGQFRRLRLSWISPARTMYLFTNHDGQAALALPAAKLAERFAQGEAILDDEAPPLLDRVVDLVLDDFDASH